MNLAERLEAGKILDGECWRWSGTHTQGWGTIMVLGRKQRVHRVAFEVYIGPLGPDEDARQTCTKFRDCWRPEHLQRVDLSVPSERRTERRTPKNAKLNPDKVREIRARLAAGEAHTEIARDFQVSDVLIHYVEQGKVWAHVGAIEENAPKTKMVVRRRVRAEVP